MVKARHLVNGETARRGFHAEQGAGGASVVESVAVKLAVLKVAARDRDNEHGGLFGPRDIKLHENADSLPEVLRVVRRSHKVGPGLLVVARGSPSCSFEQAGEDGGFDRLIRKSARAPAIADKVVNRKICGRGFLHCVSSLPSVLQFDEWERLTDTC